MTRIELTLDGEKAATEIKAAIVAGWTGRDKDAVEKHIEELEELGVPRPSATPIYYRVSASRVTVGTVIESTPASSGEVEAVLLRSGGALWVGVGSDHTDREVEAYGVAVSKQLCEKPIAASFWRFEEVVDHWDELVLRAWIAEEGEEVLYQEGTLASILPAVELIEGAAPPLTDGTVMFCGTFAAIGGVRSSARFRYQLEDPILERKIDAGYEVLSLPLVS